MFEGLECISRLITRYALVESMYLKKRSLLEEQLCDALIRVYTSILMFLAYSKKYYVRCTSGKFKIPLCGISNNNKMQRVWLEEHFRPPK